MTKDAGLDLLKAVRAALIADAYISSTVSARVFSSWANVATAPFIRMRIGRSERFEIEGETSSGDGSETEFSLHIFAAEEAPNVCRRLAGRVRDVLQDNDITLDDSNTIALQYRDTIPLGSDPDDPSLQMAVVRFVAMTTSK